MDDILFHQLTLTELRELEIKVDNKIREKRIVEVRKAVAGVRNPRVLQIFQTLDGECRFNRHVVVDALLEELEILLDIAA